MIFPQILRSKFEELRHRVASGEERFNQCEELAKKLLATDSPYIADIEKRQEALEYVLLLPTDNMRFAFLNTYDKGKDYRKIQSKHENTELNVIQIPFLCMRVRQHLCEVTEE